MLSGRFRVRRRDAELELDGGPPRARAPPARGGAGAAGAPASADPSRLELARPAPRCGDPARRKAPDDGRARLNGRLRIVDRGGARLAGAHDRATPATDPRRGRCHAGGARLRVRRRDGRQRHRTDQLHRRRRPARRAGVRRRAPAGAAERRGRGRRRIPDLRGGRPRHGRGARRGPGPGARGVIPRALIGLLAAAGVAVASPGCGLSSDSPAHRPQPPRLRPIAELENDASHLPWLKRKLAHPLKRGVMPKLLNKHDVYAADRPNRLSPTVQGDPERIYVPNSQSNTVDVINPPTYKVVDHFRTGANPQHVTPSWDLRTLWVDNNAGNSLTPLDPQTGHRGQAVRVADPYNMYFTPDGRYAIVVAEALQRLDFLDARTMKLVHSVHVDCLGIDHADFTANGRYAIFSCEFSGKLLKLDVAKQRVLGTIHVKEGGSPQDVKTSPDGKVMYVADQYAAGVQIIDPKRFREIGFVHTGAGAHGLYVNRSSTWLYVTNRRGNSVSVIDLHSRKVVHTWQIPGGGTPDMGGLSADGKVLWLSGRYSSVVYALNARTGHLLARIPVGSSPHGLCVYPQPGRYSLGHTGVFR